MIIELILATDLMRHYELVSAFNKKVSRAQTEDCDDNNARPRISYITGAVQLYLELPLVCLCVYILNFSSSDLHTYLLNS